jgi:CubicO group peptidase (beta-lactamase class C family)
MANPRFWSAADLDRPEWRRVEFPSGNGFGNARSLARFYAAFASPGGPLRLDPATFEALTAYPEAPPEGWMDAVACQETAYALGLLRRTRSFRFGTSERAFGMAGAGGGFAFADPDTALGYAYVTNRMGVRIFDDPRELSLREAVLACARRA